MADRPILKPTYTSRVRLVADIERRGEQLDAASAGSGDGLGADLYEVGKSGSLQGRLARYEWNSTSSKVEQVGGLGVFLLTLLLSCSPDAESDLLPADLFVADGYPYNVYLDSFLVSPDTCNQGDPGDDIDLSSCPSGGWPGVQDAPDPFVRADMAVHCAVPPTGTDTIVHLVGDSITRGVDGLLTASVYANRVGAQFTASGLTTVDASTFVGTVSLPESDANVVFEAAGGLTWESYVGAASPYWNGALDVPNYFTINGTPSHVVVMLGTNDAFGEVVGTPQWDATKATSLAAAAELVQA